MHITSVISPVNSRTDAHVARIARHREARQRARSRKLRPRWDNERAAWRAILDVMGGQDRPDVTRGVASTRERWREWSSDPLADRAARIALASSVEHRVEAIVETSVAVIPRGRLAWVYDADSIETYQRVTSARGAR
jgi:hypothetical protein